MTIGPAAAAQDGAKGLALEADARTLAEQQKDLERAPGLLTRFLAPPSVAPALKRAQRHLAGVPNGCTALPKAAEWFLDNYYLIRRVARQVEEELPRGFVRHLPQLASGVAKGSLRIDALARAFVSRSHLDFDEAELRAFIAAYQETAPLTIAELWALPTMLRASVLQRLLGLLSSLDIPALAKPMQARKLKYARKHKSAPEPLPTAFRLDPSAGIERSIHALRLLDEIDWKALFEKTNRVEAILKTDPAGIYTRMDFETCDAYRKVVETIAWSTGYAEEEVAELAVHLAQEGGRDPLRGHVGYHLLSHGRRALEERLGLRAHGIERLRRAALRSPTAAYLIPLACLTLLPLLAIGIILDRYSAHAVLITCALLVAAIPFSMLGTSLLCALFARLLPPRTLAKLDYAKGIPSDARTLIAIPTLLSRTDEIAGLVRQLELHYLSNVDPNFQFALLTDDIDATEMPDSEQLLEQAKAAIGALNLRHGLEGRGPFHLLHRTSRWNPGEERFMGWERKRGKLEELNRLLRGDLTTSYVSPAGDPARLQGIRFVITLDTDTQLPMGSARKLVGLLMHPLNRAVFDEKSGRVVDGYTIVQPRVETSPTSARQTRFSRIFAGDIGFDIYTHANSELYQDLFGSGIYVGKGIYDVDAFMRSLEGRAPENALVSHDLFEGIHGRAALATDIVLFEGYPPNYAAYAKRLHRWLRGDWQLLRWLFPFVPSSSGKLVRNRLTGIDRWKIFDNLRRSLTAPLLVIFIALGLAWLPGNPLWWTLAALAVLIAPALQTILLGSGRRMSALARTALAIVFLPSEAAIVLDAVTRVWIRTSITRKHLLQWTTAAQTALGISLESPRALFWRALWPAPLFAAVLSAGLVWQRLPALKIASPLLLVWFLSPEIARWISAPMPARAPLRFESKQKLRLLARLTWRFFDAFAGPGDQWLPVDNHQEEPNEQTAHRTSPTNIGLMLLATLSARDFGYITTAEFTLRVRRALESIARLQHCQGHLLNWYDTKNLQPLLPHYVSTVDSGNLSGCLLALAQGCRELGCGPVVRAASWTGLEDALALLARALGSIAQERGALDGVLEGIGRSLARARDEPGEAYAELGRLSGELLGELGRELHHFLEGAQLHQEAERLRELRLSLESFKHQLAQLQRELDSLLPWLALQTEAKAHGLALPPAPALDEIPAVSQRLCAQLAARSRERETPALDASARALTFAFRQAAAGATALQQELLALAARARDEALGMDFRLLFDGERKLFHIGYNATLDQIDDHYYDLLASEARLASYIAIVKRDVPEAHWYALGRPMTRVAGAPALLSWGGTMFEYLMPLLLMKSGEGTLLSATYEQIIDAQIIYGAEGRAPWGISESAYAKLDAQQTYQYHSFGVPGLGFKRGLEQDRVVAPYASLLALPLRPDAVVANLDRLEALGMLGTYGLYEALDLTPARLPDGRASAVIRSYMAHHQGMLLISIGNLLNERSMVDRFHRSPLVGIGEFLLNEHAPDSAPKEWPVARAGELPSPAAPELPRAPDGWDGNDRTRLQACCLSNGRLRSAVTNSGGGGLSWQGIALTRYQPDSTRDDEGIWLHLRDEDEPHRAWLATSAEGRTTFSMHKAEFHRRDEGVSVHVDIAVAPSDDVELRQITLHNETDRARRLTVTSAARPVLLEAKQAGANPSFTGMFIESELLLDLNALLFSRRQQSPKDEPVLLAHRLVGEPGAVTLVGSESDRNDFHGRGNPPRAPRALAAGRAPGHGRTGAVLDPIMSLTASVELKAKGSVTFAFVTSVAKSRSAVLELLQKFGSMHAVGWAFRDAEQESPRRLQKSRVEPALIPAIQRLYSALLFSDPSLRAPFDGEVAERPCQKRLWERGISGDDPIVLVRVRDAAAQIVAEALAAQRFLRACGVRFDLVLLDEQASGYVTEGSGTLRNVLAQNEALEWLNQHGGVFVVAADQIPLAERRHLEACAKVFLDTNDSSLAARVGRGSEGAPKLPRFEPSLSGDAKPRPMPRGERAFDNGLGGFSADGREYLISVGPGRSTPAPWCNVLANPAFGCLTSESALGASWSQNSGENRLTPWRSDPVFDTPSEALYLRDEETSALWSPTPLPAGQGAEVLIAHGAGYTSYRRECHGLEQELKVFVPPRAPLKIVTLRIRNTLARHRRLTATYYAEWVLGSRRETQAPYIVSELERESACLLARCEWNAEFGGRVAFLAAKDKLHGFTADRCEFLGLRGNEARPEVLERWGLSGNLAPGADPCAALQIHLDLAPGQELLTHFVLGQASSKSEALQLVAEYREPLRVESAFQELREYWDGLLGQVQIKTPEPAMDLLLNRWLLYQTISARLFGRTGFYQSSGAFGYRDQLQDIQALFHAAPGQARAHILEAARHQFEEGDVLHWWHPPSGRGVRTRCSDDLAWLPYVAAGYVEATGDIGILSEQIPFLAAAPLRADERDRYAQFELAPGGASLLEHCRRALSRALTEGAHGLPLMGDGDWNDGMNRVGADGRGESVWLGWFLCAAIDRYVALAASLKDINEASLWSGRAARLRAALRESAWDGDWYLRAFHDDGSLIGSAKSRECRIDSIAQSWAVLSSSDPRADGRARAGLSAADAQLLNEPERLALLFTPAFDSALHDPGYIRAYPPGIRENGGQYTHAATWLGFAHTALGEGAKALHLFQLLNPILRAESPSRALHYRVEPYALAGDVYGCAPWTGRGGWTWYTGAAAWMWRLGVEEILGLKSAGGQLRIAPCIPPEWRAFEAWVRLGAQLLHVSVENPDGISSGRVELTLDGAPLEGDRVALDPTSTGTRELRVRMRA